MADVPRVAVRPPIRCHYTEFKSVVPACSKEARWVRQFGDGDEPRFFCGWHSFPGDTPIADDTVFRLVSVTLEVRLCGVSATPAVAHADALSRLEAALASIGGVINMHACRSMLARAEPPTPVGPQKSEQGRG